MGYLCSFLQNIEYVLGVTMLYAVIKIPHLVEMQFTKLFLVFLFHIISASVAIILCNQPNIVSRSTSVFSRLA